MKTGPAYVFVILALLSRTGVAAQGAAEDRWQLRQLFEPSATQLAVEKRGRVFIYDGLNDTDVEQAMDEEYDRVHSMMFIRTVVTDVQGEPLRDPDTGELVVEDDDCD